MGKPVGAFVDGKRVSSVVLENLGVGNSSSITIRIGVKADAAHVGGLNIFGSRFGNYPQDIMLRLRYQ